MANQNVNVQYKLRGDTLANLEAKNAVYADREPIIVQIPADAEKNVEAAILLKIGDGSTAFKSLPYVTALAGNVPDWAMAASKPSYSASEISDISDYDTDTQYKLEANSDDGHTLTLYSKGLKDTEWSVVGNVTTVDTTYTAATGDNAVTVDNTNHTIGINVSNDTGNIISKKNNGLYAQAPVVNVVKKTTANTGYIATYQITIDNVPITTEIDIPKDYLVKSANIYSVTTANSPYTGAAVGDKYIDFVVNTVGDDGNESHIYLSVQDLVDEYTQGNGIEISNTNVISIKLGTNVNGLSVGANGLELAVATDTTPGAMSATDHEKLTGIATGATKVESSTTNGSVKINGTDTTVYTLPSTVLDSGDTLILDGGNA